MWMGRPV